MTTKGWHEGALHDDGIVQYLDCGGGYTSLFK